MAFQVSMGEMGFGQEAEREGHPGQSTGVSDSPSDFVLFSTAFVTC